MSKICSKLTVKRAERGHWRRSGIFIVNCGQISNFVLVFSLTLNKWMSVGTHLNRIKVHLVHRAILQPRLSFRGLATLLKKRLWHRCFPVNFAKFLRAPFSQNTYGRLLLEQVMFCIICLIISLITCRSSPLIYLWSKFGREIILSILFFPNFPSMKKVISRTVNSSKKVPSQHLLVQSHQWKRQNNVWNLFKAKNKRTRITSLFWCILC